MEASGRFRELSTELMQSGVVEVGKKRVDLLSETPEVKAFSQELSSSIRQNKELSQVNPPSDTLLLVQWSLLRNTGHTISSKAARKGLQKLCCTIIDETSDSVLNSRRSLLCLPEAAKLRLSIWLAVNQWLSWNPNGIDRRQFKYWDLLPDQIPTEVVLYTGEKAKRIHELLTKDIRRLGDLGTFLTTSTALSNNPDASASDRVISAKTKLAIDHLLDVSQHGLESATNQADMPLPDRSSQDGQAEASQMPA